MNMNPGSAARIPESSSDSNQAGKPPFALKKKSHWIFNPVNRQIAAWGFLGCLAIGFSLAEYRSWRISHFEQELKEVGAKYKWTHTTTDLRLIDRPQETQKILAKYLGNSMVSDFSEVKIENDGITPERLGFLADLTSLRSLDVKSEAITDETLRMISKLPDLRYLSLAGNQFSIFGLLELREAHNLKRLQLDADHLTPNELALLKSELDGVQFASRNSKNQTPLGTEQEMTMESYEIEELGLTNS